MRFHAPLLMLVLLLLPQRSVRGQFLGDPDSLAPAPVQDSTGRLPSPGVPGSVDRFLDSTLILTRLAREWIDYRSIADLAAEGPGIYLRDQNSFGQYTQITVGGSGWRTVGIARDGRPLADPASGVFNPYHIAPEEIDRVEFIPGPRAFLYGAASSGGFVNLVTRLYDHDVPFTKVNYSESSYDLQWTDGTFSQNITRDVGVMVGFQTHSLTGRYPNSASSLWNTRAAVHVRITPTLHALLSHRYTSSNTGLNGGIDEAKTSPEDVFSATQATVRNTDAYEKINRHDLDLMLIGNLTGGEEDRTTLSLFSSWNLREYRDEENRTDPNGLFVTADHRSSWMGARLQQDLESGWQALSAGGELEMRQIEGSPTLGRRRNVNGAGWVKEELRFLDPLIVTGYLRYDRYLGDDYLGYGADLTVAVGPGLSLFGGASRSRRVPSYHELYWTDSSVTRPAAVQAETHSVGEIGIRLGSGSSFRTAARVFYRRVENPILFTPTGPGEPFPAYSIVNGERRTTGGVDLRVRARIWSLVLEATALWLRQEAEGRLSIYPEWSGTGGVYFWETLFHGHLDLKTGFHVSLQSSSTGEVFNPASLAYVLNDGQSIGSYATVGFFLIARIGDAYIHLMWENLPNVQAYATPYYPLLDRTLRFGIRWEFFN
jgi:outer membrane cobalamin receptor